MKAGGGSWSESVLASVERVRACLVVAGADPNAEFMLANGAMAMPLQHAACGCDVDVVRELISAGAVVDSALLLKSNQVPLMAAATHGRAAVVRELLACGADVKASISTGTSAPRSALCCAG